MAEKDIFKEYKNNNTEYTTLKFSLLEKSKPENLPNILIFTQLIIDQFINKGIKRIAIVIPFQEKYLYPLFYANSYKQIKKETKDFKPLIYDIQKGQKLRLGKAVVEFDSIDLINNTIKLKIGKTDQMLVTYNISDFTSYFEKCEGSLSKYETWVDALKQITSKKNIVEINNRTRISETTMIITSKNEFKDSVNTIQINHTSLQNCITYGEIDLKLSNKYKLYNKGKLDCIPSIAITSKITELAELIDSIPDYSSINSIYVTNDKFTELLNNNNDFITCLKTEIPFIVFLSEDDYENYGTLHDYGFKFWQWQPSTINNKIFIQNNYSNSSVFGQLPLMIKNAANARFNVKQINTDLFKQTLLHIKKLSKISEDKDSKFKHIVRMIWLFQNKLKSLPLTNEMIITNFRTDLSKIHQEWDSVSDYYSGQELYTIIDFILTSFKSLLSNIDEYKEKLLKETLSASNLIQKNVLVLLPDTEYYSDKTSLKLEYLNNFKKIECLCLNEFYHQCNYSFVTYDYIFVPWFDWFDRNDYIRIKRSFCYKNLIYILYDFENKWRNAFVKQIDKQIPYEDIIQNGKLIGLSKKDYLHISFDLEEEIPIDDTYTEVNELNYSKDILSSTIKQQMPSNYNETVECIPLLLSNKKIAYFHPEHDVIDITSLLFNEIANPQKKATKDLHKGDRLLIRQSGKDIIHEKADELMRKKREENLRSISERWIKILQAFPIELGIKDIISEMNEFQINCTPQQVRYWLSGESICPRNKKILLAIGEIYKKYTQNNPIDIDYINEIDMIYNAGQKILTYHQQAGRWLTAELKNKANEIRNIANSDYSNGIIDGIGEVIIYNVEEILEKTEIPRWEINKIEDLY